MRDNDMEMLDRWRSSDNGRAYRSLCDFEDAGDNLTDAIKTLQGSQCIQEHWDRFQVAKKKIIDIELALTPFAEAAE